ncbi:MAG: hypothetical protein K2X87_04820, partial [Gemmataceae bacterium]|nr:hypothetical protein [Gemmataceae bacterium]
RPLLEWAAGEFGRLSAEHPTDAVFPRHLAGCRLWLGQLEYLAGRADAARAAFGGMAEALRGRPGGPPVSLWPPLTPLVPVPGVFDPRADAAELSAASRGVGGRACRVPLGWALLRAGRYREAAGVLDAEFARDPSPVAERAVAGYGLVVCHVKLGDLAAARRAWEGAEGLDGLRYATDGRVRIARQEAGAALGLAGR